jgi:hypothetical protein
VRQVIRAFSKGEFFRIRAPGVVDRFLKNDHTHRHGELMRPTRTSQSLASFAGLFCWGGVDFLMALRALGPLPLAKLALRSAGDDTRGVASGNVHWCAAGDDILV